MDVFVILSLALLVVALGLTAVVARELRQTVRNLGQTLRDSAERLAPAGEELQSELAVTGLEVQALTDGLQRAADEREARRRHRSGFRRRR